MKTLIAISLVALLGACNTVAGAGDDLSAGARKIQNWF